jgi:carbonic anhydrase
MGISPGEVFVHRNISKIVPNNNPSSRPVISYSVLYVRVNQILVCGHYYCGGVKAATEAKDLEILDPWLRNIRTVYRTHRAELNAIFDEDLKYKRLVELNVQ